VGASGPFVYRGLCGKPLRVKPAGKWSGASRSSIMNTVYRMFHFAVACLVLTLAACGGGGDSSAGGGTPTTGSVVGAAGGTVLGPNGAKVEIPPGALSTDTAINVAPSVAGAPALPSGISAVGQMFAFTPHGTTFAVPVTISLPFDPASVPAGTAPQLYKTDAQNQWRQVAGAVFGTDSVSAQVTSFSDATVVIPPLQRNEPTRDWVFSVEPGNGSAAFPLQGTGGSGTQVGGLLEQIVNFGPVPPELDEEMTTFTGTRPSDGQASGMVFGSADGQTYGVFAEAPYTRYGSSAPVGGQSQLEQRQSFIKRADDASLNFTLTDIFICGFDYDSSPLVPVNGGGLLNTVGGQVELRVTAWTKTGSVFFSVHGIAGVAGSKEEWFGNALDMGGSHLAWPEFPTPAGSQPSFETSQDELIDAFGNGTRGCLTLIGTRTYTVDLSKVDKDEEFTLQSIALALASNLRGGGFVGDGSASGAFAYLRDPLSMGGTSITFAGLEPTNRPDAAPPPEVPVAPAACVPGPAPDPAAGVIQFSAPSYSASESNNAVPTVKVTRSGGSRGAVTATFSTSDGSARSGTDYTAVARTVFFADGDTQARTMDVPITPNTVVNPARTVNLSLSQPGGCTALGAQSTAELSIEDDEPPPTSPAIFTIGGTVTGATGPVPGATAQVSLVLQLPTTGDSGSFGNGPFAFTLRASSGDNYAVRVGTQAPHQVCTVANGTGTVSGNVNNIEVTCVPASP
jgi:Calx-beta domain/ZU5 domain